MLRILLVYTFVFFNICPILSQPPNLVPNPDFETYSSCTGLFTLGYVHAPPWRNTMHLHTCFQEVLWGWIYHPLLNSWGYQVPHSGEGVGWAVIWGVDDVCMVCRTYPTAPLAVPMQAGMLYNAGFYASPTFGSDNAHPPVADEYMARNFVTDAVGIRFHNDTLELMQCMYCHPPDIRNLPGNYLSDTSAWYEVSGYYVAKGGEEYMSIGNFYSNPNTPVQLFSTRPDSFAPAAILYYIDDVWVRAVPPLVQSVAVRLCAPDTLHAQPGYAAYCWSTGDSAQSLAVSQAGTYYVRQYGQGFSSLRVDTFHVGFPSVLDAGASERWLCPGGDTLTLAATPGFASYLWNTGATTPSISVTQPGTYAVRASDSCSVQHDTVWVRSRDTLTLALGPDPYLCPGGTLTLSAQAGFASYLWDTGAVTPALTVSQPGAHWLQTTDACGTERDSVVVYNADTLSLDLGADRLVCGQPPLTLHAPPGYASYLWGDGTATPALTVFQSGTYTLSATDGCGTDRDSVLVTFQPVPPPPAVRDTSYCKGAASVSLQAQGTGLLWYATASATQGSPTAPLPPTAQPGLRLWYVSQTVGGCESERAAVAVRVLAPPRFGQPLVPRFCEGETLLLCATAQDAESYRWLHGGTENCSAVGAESTYALVAENRCGADTLTFLLLSDPDCGFQVWIPSAFSPNGDGENDFFRAVSPASFSWFSLRVYDRWGVPLWEGGALGDAWDGTAKGLPVPEGAYAFVLECTHAASGRTYRRAGTVTVLR